jgi:hypothetical protein
MEIKRKPDADPICSICIFDVRAIERGKLYDDKVATRGRKCVSATH